MSIYFIRHGQSEFNAAYDGSGDPMIFDAPLTALGQSQAAQARETIAELNITRVITSPFTRAIQTAQIIFEDIAPIEVRHGHHEHLAHSCDVGRHPKALKTAFPDLEFDHLPHIWWHAGNPDDPKIIQEPMPVFRTRIAEFVTTLEDVGSQTVAFVGHGNAFKEIIGYALDNCQIHKHR